MASSNTFRFFVVLSAVSCIDKTTAFSFHRKESPNLAHEDTSVIKEVTANTSSSNDRNIRTDPAPNPVENISTEKLILTTTMGMDENINDSVVSNTENSENHFPFRSVSVTEDILEKFTEVNEDMNDQTIRSTTIKALDKINTSNERDRSWKKYKTIHRKRQPTSSEDVRGNKNETMIEAETKRSRASLHDTVTSDIPSLEKLKNDLLTSNLKQTTSKSDSDDITDSSVKFNSTKWGTVESMRAGYLDLSERTTLTDYLSAPETFDLNINPKENLRAMFDTDIKTRIPEDNSGSREKSQNHLSEDDIKEELLEERVISENKQYSNHITESNITAINETHLPQEQTVSTNNMKVKSVSGEKFKNNSLYTVNPNYKPLKKIEVQPPKPFIRDPDDNSWRNESLSSLGIVFKPKNSTKPFTQVLKNKTETEWNSLLERDNKNDIPDLRERLQKMAEKRKSRRKKTDLFGNVLYIDYEENSSSVENTPKEDLSTTYLPEYTNSINTSSDLSTDITLNISLKTEQIHETDSYTTRKYKKFFHVPEFYDSGSTNEDDTDYYNLAKVEIKKFSTSKKPISHVTKTTTATSTNTIHPETPESSSSTTTPPLTNPPGRVATVQYFPPLTTQRVNINDYDNIFKQRVNSFTETVSPKNVLHVVKPTTNANHDIYHEPHNNMRFNHYGTTPKPNFDKTLYFTHPPLTTQPEYTLLTEDESTDKDAYVMRHYKDFLNIAAKNNEVDRNIGYVPYTEQPVQGVTKTDMAYETEKPKMSLDDESDDYDTQFRKDVVQRFVDNLNQNSDDFRPGYPILFNSSVIHRDTLNGGDVASSRAFMRGFYNDIKPKPPQKFPCEPNCEGMNVELPPVYELSYYMPEQEEADEAAPQPATASYAYRL